MNQILSKLDSLYDQGRMSEIEPFLCNKIAELRERGHFTGLVTLWSELGGYLRSCGRLEESEESFQKALRLQEEAGPENRVSRATLLINLAGTYRLWNRFTDAMRLYNEAEMLLEKDSYPYASLLNNKGLLCQELGRWEEAEKLLLNALNIMKETPECGEEIATAFINLALLKGNQGDSERELEYLKQALSSYEEREATGHPHYAAALSALGGSLYHSGNLSGAAEAFEQAGKLMYRLFGENREYEVIQKNLGMIRRELEAGQADET